MDDRELDYRLTAIETRLEDITDILLTVHNIKEEKVPEIEPKKKVNIEKKEDE